MATTKITVNNNGSLKVEGDFEIVDRNGDNYGLQAFGAGFLTLESFKKRTSELAKNPNLLGPSFF